MKREAYFVMRGMPKDEIRNTRYLESMVQDTGIGITEPNLPVIFESTLGKGATFTVAIPIKEP